jgi:hypothetical protein
MTANRVTGWRLPLALAATLIAAAPAKAQGLSADDFYRMTPAAPVHVTVRATRAGALVCWQPVIPPRDANYNPRIRHFRVYRLAGSSGRVLAGRSLATCFLDRKTGASRYAVTTVYWAGLESDLSEPATVKR